MLKIQPEELKSITRFVRNYKYNYIYIYRAVPMVLETFLHRYNQINGALYFMLRLKSKLVLEPSWVHPILTIPPTLFQILPIVLDGVDLHRFCFETSFRRLQNFLRYASYPMKQPQPWESV